MEQTAYQPRRIETVEDVIAVLDSPAASFTELMDCVSVARVADAWQLRHLAAERAFFETKLEAPAAVASLSGAAEVVIDNYLKVASSLNDLHGQISAAETWLSTNRSKLDAVGASEFADKETQLLAELQVLLSDDAPESKVRLCSRLRKVDRSDLGIEAVRPVANKERDNVAALTTLGAAYCDMGEYSKAERALKAALKLQNDSGQARVALSRVFQESGQPHKALDLAKVAFVADANEFTTHRLLAAAAAVGDVESFDQAVAEVERAVETDAKGSPDYYLLLLAAEALLDQGRSAEAADIVGRMVSNGVSFGGTAAKRFAAIKKPVEAVNKPNLFE
jgi:tetratricopeptide (TPR) repeat protein